jgi:hypothetical protein
MGLSSNQAGLEALAKTKWPGKPGKPSARGMPQRAGEVKEE